MVKFGTESIELCTWVQRRQYTALKDVLGTGVTVHLQVIIKSFFFIVLIQATYMSPANLPGFIHISESYNHNECL